MAVERLAVVLNPWANRGRAAEAAEEITWRLRAAGFDPELVVTPSAGAGIELARTWAGRDVAAVIAAGGDGTINEVANGLVGTGVPMGILPIGTGNDLIKMFDLAPDLATAVERFVAAVPRAIDVGYANERAFVNGVGVGIDAQIAIEAQKIKRLRGLSVYAVAVAKTIVRYRAPEMTLSMNGVTRTVRRLMVTAGNGRCHGGGFWITPEATVDDGLLDICEVEAMGLVAMVRRIPHVVRGTHLALREVTFTRTAALTVRSEAGVPVHVDGEILGERVRELVLRLEPGGLRVRL